MHCSHFICKEKTCYYRDFFTSALFSYSTIKQGKRKCGPATKLCVGISLINKTNFFKKFGLSEVTLIETDAGTNWPLIKEDE